MKLKKLKWEVVSSPQTAGDNAIGILTLNEPEHGNAWGPRMTLEFDHLMDEIRLHQTVRVVIITGAGGNFCAGDCASTDTAIPPTCTSARRGHGDRESCPD